MRLLWFLLAAVLFAVAGTLAAVVFVVFVFTVLVAETL